MNLKKILKEIKEKKLVIEVFGLGYIGFPLSVKLANAGFSVIGIDVDEEKLRRYNTNSLRESELYLKNDFLKSHKKGKIKFSQKATQKNTAKIGIICVPTPISKNSDCSNTFVNEVVGDFVSSSKKGDMIIIESSIKIGTTERIKKIIESKGFVVGKDFGLCYCAERIDPQNKQWNLHNIPRVIFCSDDISYFIAQEIYLNINKGNLIRVSSPKVAEVVKSFENAFRLTNISLVNELALLCEALEIDVGEVIRAAATKPFGFKPFYTSAGAGGHCIPKDPIFLLDSAKKIGFGFQTIESAIKTNDSIPKYIVKSIDKILLTKNLEKSVIVCGLTYKENIDDMRDSPGFKIMNELTKKKFKVLGFDPYFRKELYHKYLKENGMEEMKFNIINSLDNDTVNKYNCMCIVQHHKKMELKIKQIYENSLSFLIYDCQNRLRTIPRSKSILKSFGN
jgi:UDP-N-acetyl-D-glucosamine dehydrogenase